MYEYNNPNWTDQLTAFNGKQITYDAIGNPLTFGDNISFTWKNGRELATFTDTSRNLHISYLYNDDGVRIQKTVNGVITRYFLEGDHVVFEQTGDRVIRYSRDEQGNLVSLNLNGREYYYVFNIQGDIIGLLDENLDKVVNYTYDSWGSHISIKDNSGNSITDLNHVAHINPYRYRSYRFDTKTGLYYLLTRYYNPEWARFINADGLISTGTSIFGHNIYTYTDNNPVNGVDPDGEWTRAIHERLTRTAISHALVGLILAKYRIPNTVANRNLAHRALVKGSVLPDVSRQRYTAAAGWHGFRQNNRTSVHRVIRNQYSRAHNALLRGNIALGFVELGKALHTIQDSTAHYRIGGRVQHDWRMDSLRWDFRGGRWRLTNGTISGNPRARLAVQWSNTYMRGFLNARGTNFPSFIFVPVIR